MERQLFHYLTVLRNFLRLSPAQRLKYIVRPDRDFTRSSPLSFRRTASLILGLLRKSTAIELFDFFAHCQEKSVSKSAFSQRRRLIKVPFFQDFLELSARQFYHSFSHYHTWRGLRLFAIDGTAQALPHEEWIGDALGWHKNQFTSTPSTRLLFTFDVLNKIIFRVDFHTQNESEIITAYPNVEQLPQDAIYIYDRGFTGYGLPFLHQRHGSFYVIRLKKDTPNYTDFVQSEENERLITITLKDRSYRSLLKLGLDPIWKMNMIVRLIRVDLPDGEVEVLMTNLMHRRRFHYRRIGELYARRWGVETAIFNLKSFLQLALTSAYTQPGVEQDLWASFWFFNLNSALAFAQKTELKKQTSNRQYTYQINRNLAAGLIKRWVPSLFLDNTRKWRAKTQVLMKQIIAYPEPYRPRPSRVRTRKILRGQGRHIYQPNYRSSL